MATLPRALMIARARSDDSTWHLLRADLAPVVIAVLDEHLGGEARRLDAEELYERIDADLEQLRAHGFELSGNARGYVADWRVNGYLERRPAETSRGETFELTPAAHEAIRFLTQLTTPRQTVTESRLSSIARQLQELATDSDPDASRRLQQLYAQRDRIDAQIEAISRGELPIIEQDRALERARDILAQAEDIPADFARVRTEFESLNRDLRVSVMESDEAQRTVLDEIFRGVDLISDSDAGRSFTGFSALVLDPEVGEALENDIRQVLDRDFARELTPAQRRFLLRLLRTLKDRSSEIHEVITSFARGLRRYVQSQDYQRDRTLRRALREALVAGHEASKNVKPYQLTSLSFDLAAVRITSAGSIRLHDPSEYDASEATVQHSPETVDLDELRRIARETEIDFSELIANVNATIDERGEATVGQVLESAPATQGVASVVGLLSLGAEFGEALSGETETLRWSGEDDVNRRADVPYFRFVRRVS